MNNRQNLISKGNRNLTVIVKSRKARLLLAAWVILMLTFSSLPGQSTEKAQPPATGTPPTTTSATVTTPPAAVTQTTTTVTTTTTTEAKQKPPSEKEPTSTLSPINLKTNPFKLETKRVVPGTMIKVLVDKSILAVKDWKIDEIGLCFATTPKQEKNGWASITTWYFNEIDGKTYLMAQLPEWNDLKNIKQQSIWRGPFGAYEGDLKITHSVGKDKMEPSILPMEIPDKRWAFVWAIFLSLLLLPLLSRIINDNFSFKKLIVSKKDGISISISKTQILIWTIVVLFGIIYVYLISEVLLAITPQILFLLGIGGGTAAGAQYIAAKAAAQQAAADQSKDVQVQDGQGQDNQIKDAAGTPSDFFKVQMMAFTLVIAAIVLKEIIANNAFPDLPENLVLVMGISNALYLGNKYKP